MIGQYDIGAEIGAGLPEITGALTENSVASSTQFLTDVLPVSSGAVYINSTYTAYGIADSTVEHETAGDISFMASKSNSIYNSSATVQPETIIMTNIIKF